MDIEMTQLRIDNPLLSLLPALEMRCLTLYRYIKDKRNFQYFILGAYQIEYSSLHKSLSNLLNSFNTLEPFPARPPYYFKQKLQLHLAKSRW